MVTRASCIMTSELNGTTSEQFYEELYPPSLQKGSQANILLTQRITELSQDSRIVHLFQHFNK